VDAHPADEPGPFALVTDLDEPVLPAETHHHLARALRLRAGDLLVLGDGAGRWRPARFGDAIEPAGPIRSAPRPAPLLTVGFALVKGGRPELVVQKLTELGIDRIVPFRADRSVVRWDDDKASKALARLRAVARAATEQCHRPWLPDVADVADVASLLAAPGAALADRTGDPLTLRHPLVLVGPEGGWSPDERGAALAVGAPCVGVSPHVLRAETAAVTVGAILAGLRSGVLGEASGR
jgi:16S rRNA (uracil1498-N3)-methyltransferase